MTAVVGAAVAVGEDEVTEVVDAVIDEVEVEVWEVAVAVVVWVFVGVAVVEV